MSTTINPENYNWTVTNAVATVVNPWEHNPEDANSINPIAVYAHRKWQESEQFCNENNLHTNAPNGQYSGDAFEVAKEYKHPYGAWLSDTQPTVSNSGYERRVYLYIKCSHLPQVLKEADYNSWTEGDELKKLYKRVRWEDTQTISYDALNPNRCTYVYRLTNTSAVQEAETVEEHNPDAYITNPHTQIDYPYFSKDTVDALKAEFADLNKQVVALKAALKEAKELIDELTTDN